MTPEFYNTFFLGEGEVQGGGGVQNLGKSDYVISERSLNMQFVNFYQTNLYFFYLKFFNFM